MEKNRLYDFIENEFGEDTGMDMACVEGDDTTWLGVTNVLDDDDGDGQTRLTWYFRFAGNREAFVFLVVGMQFNDLFDDFSQTLDEDNCEAFCNAWPLLMMALKNGWDDNYAHSVSPALIKVESPLGDGVWVMARKLENIAPDDIANEYVMDKVSEMCKSTLEMILELNQNDVSTKDKVLLCAKAAKRGWDCGKVACAAVGVVGAFLGFDLD